MSALADIPLEIFQLIFKYVVGAQPSLPPHKRFADTKLRLAQGVEVIRAQELRSLLYVSRGFREVTTNLFYRNASFVFHDLDELSRFIDHMPDNAKRIPISIEVGLSGRAPNQTWDRARKITIDRLRLVITTSTSSLISRKHSHKLEHMQGLGKLRRLRGVRRVEVAWSLKSGGLCRIYKKQYIGADRWEKSLKVVMS